MSFASGRSMMAAIGTKPTSDGAAPMSAFFALSGERAMSAVGFEKQHHRT
jgi:hypothetical protein